MQWLIERLQIGEIRAENVAVNFAKLELENIDPEQLLDLCKRIASHGQIAAQSLLQNFDQLGLKKLPSQYLIELYKHIASQGLKPATTLAKNFDKLRPEKAKLTDLLDLYKLITAESRQAKNILDFDKLGITEIFNHFDNLQDYLDAYKLIASQGEWAERMLIESSAKLRIVEIVSHHEKIEERMNACKLIASQGWLIAANALIANFDKLGLEKAKLSDFLDFYQLIGSHANNWGNLHANFHKLGLIDSYSITSFFFSKKTQKITLQFSLKIPRYGEKFH